jgi:hypothetical protein
MNSNVFQYNSESDEDIYENLVNIIYHPEETSKTKYNIGLCELYNKNIHGSSENEILNHYLVINVYKYFNKEYILEDCDFINNQYKLLTSYSHDIFPNYSNIVLMKNYIKPEIIECKRIQSGHHVGIVGIIKTFWIKIIQRFWKNIFKNRENAYKNRKNIFAIQHYERTGKWPAHCYFIGGLKGMLNKLKR